MEFCGNCGSYMKEANDGFVCPRCGNVVHSNVGMQSVQIEKMDPLSSICVVTNLPEDHEKVSQTCPRCGNTEAFHWFSAISGEHAGIRRERTIEHFRCTICSHSWGKSA